MVITLDRKILSFFIKVFSIFFCLVAINKDCILYIFYCMRFSFLFACHHCSHFIIVINFQGQQLNKTSFPQFLCFCPHTLNL